LVSCQQAALHFEHTKSFNRVLGRVEEEGLVRI
jgi:hypothetical protein